MLADEIRKVIKGEVENSEETLQKYSRDASLFEVKPEVVVYPKDSADIQALVKYVNKNKRNYFELSLTPRSGGTDMTGGPLNDSIIIDMTRHFKKIGRIGKDSATTQPGVYYRDFDKKTLEYGLIMPSYPASREICTVGGMVANNAGGEKTLLYGKTEDFVMELKCVLSDGKEYTFKPLTRAEFLKKIKQRNLEGKIYREISRLIDKNYDLLKKAKPNVSKNSAGYYLWNVWDPKTKKFDLTKLIVGSQGTLGIVTEIKFRLVPVKKHDRLIAIFLRKRDIPRLPEIVNTVLKHKPDEFESYDDQTLKLAIKYFPDIARIMKAKNALKLVLQFWPEFIMGIRSLGLPKLVLLVNFAGDEAVPINQKLDSLSVELKNMRLIHRVTKDVEEQKYWTIRRESFNLLRHHLHGLRTAPFIDDFVVRPEYLPEFLPKLNAILKKYPIFYTIAGHMGDGNFHIIPLMNMDDIKSKEIIFRLLDEVTELIIQYKGSITGEHNDGLIRTSYLPKMYGEEVYKLFKRVKEIFDPQNIFNPRKKVNGDMEYVKNHIIRKN
ncbi:MAG: FAD-binding oxidoreductase [Candidatus Colwellbacteria bacterium]|nr:FAD-binding oxidoreductase [Candidatus Colwellbacteria bacterium]